MSNLNFPGAFEKRMLYRLGSEWDNFKRAHEQSSPVSIRLHPLKKSSLINSEQVPWAEQGRYLPERPSFTLDPSFHGGAYYVQEASSMFLEQALKQSIDLSAPLNVLDLSAAPGGKSTHLLSLISNESLLVSNEVIRSRAAILAENIQKWGYVNCLVTNSDPKDFNNIEGFFDVIVVDAPCSGEGLFRKDPQAINEWSVENASLCSSRQKRIIHDVWPALKTDGILIYCTCTYNPDENEENLYWLQQEKEIEFIELNTNFSWGIEKVVKDKVSGYQFYPNKVKGEGFFISVIRKKEYSESATIKSKKKLVAPSKRVIESLNAWVSHPEKLLFKQHNELVFALRAEKTDEIEFLLQHLKFVYGGTNIATVKHDKLIPEHSLALSIILNPDTFNSIEVELPVALQYLRKETIDIKDVEKGFASLAYEGTRLGWVNVIQNRINNMYPSEWRIRMTR
ncbi:methyltransferase RsmF C-terminal domain-like protein [Chryseosolibacter indicus]|uniref:rRNA methyltransferase n=1 Tax=Chryseosolibacter indicus TaxID=2782351 RepID=A0ABS5VNM1_9BACT|nr:rRNA methyltransferase [Chryseosolibacter indicus]MBT1702440.1 rRNA methyltransferase [Chryseosolibacter indicus]